MKHIKKITIVMWLILLCAGTCYTLMHFNSVELSKKAYEDEKSILQDKKTDQLYAYSNELPNEMLRISMPLYLALMQQQTPDKSATDIMLNDANISEEDRVRFDLLMNQELEYFKANFEKIYYYVKDDKTGEVYTNHEELKDFNDKEIDKSKVWYLSYQRDTQGAFHNLHTSSQAEFFTSRTMTSNMRDMMNEYYYVPWSNQTDAILSSEVYSDGASSNNRVYESNTNNRHSLSFRTMSNVSFTFYIDDTMLPDSIRYNNNFMYESPYYPDIKNFYVEEQGVVFLGLIPLVFLAFLILPIKKCKESKLFIFFTEKVPLELIIASLLIPFVFGIYAAPDIIYPFFETLAKWQTVDNWGYYLLYIAGLITYAAVLLGSFLLVGSYAMIIRNAFHVGILRTIKKQSLIIYLGRKLLNFIMFFDLSSRNLRTCCILTILNALFIFFSCLMPFLFIFIIPYSVFLLYYLQKFINRYRSSYINLKNVIENVSHGDFTSDITDDLGVFEPLKYDLQKLSDGFGEAVANEMQSQRMKTELITNVSHDLKTPLTSIISYIDLLKNDDITVEIKQQYLSVLTTSAERLKHLIEDLFEVSKVNSGNIKLEKMRVDIVSLMKQVEMECNTLFTHRNLTLRNTFSDEKIFLNLDPQKTYRIFENLLFNAGKYAAEYSRVYVMIEDYGNSVEITMRNVSEHELNVSPEELTERFTRGDASRNTEGSGLGLAIAKSFVELQNGAMKITIDGDLFKVTIRFIVEKQQID